MLVRVPATAAARCGRRLHLALFLLSLARVGALAAQGSDPRLVEGRVLRPDSAGELRAVPGTWVVLHRVGSDSAGALDSVRAGETGAFRLRFRSFGDPDALYFVSASHDGIAYFGAPLRAAETTGADADIIVHDTTSAPVPLHVRGRHLVVGAPQSDGTREIVEVFEIANDSSVTRVSADGMEPTWHSIVPSGATNFQVGQGDVAPQTIRLDSGRVVVTAPFAPGLKQLSFAYRLPAGAFPVSYPMADETTVMEVLLEEEGASAQAPGLERVESVTVEGRRFARLLAQDLPSTAVLRVDVPSRALFSEGTKWALILGAVAVLGLMTALFMVNARRSARAIAPPQESADVLARAIAALDDRFEGNPDPTADGREAYARERAALKERLARALAAQQRAP